MVRSPRLLAMITVLSGTVVAQTGGLGGFSGMSNPFPTTDTSLNAASSIGWRPWLSANGNYVRPISVSEQFSDYRPSTASLSAGVGGYKKWMRRQISGAYTGSVLYNPETIPGLSKVRPSHVASINYAQQVSRRVSFSVGQLAGITYGGYGFASGFGVGGIPGVSGPNGAGSNSTFGDAANNGFVDNEVLAGRIKFYGANGGVSYLLSQRVSVSGFGGVSVVRRDQGIQGSDSYNAGAQLSYQLSSRSSMGGGSVYYHTSYPKYFGSVQGMNHFGTFIHQLNPTTIFSGMVGLANMSSEFIGAVPLSPEVAAILGAGTSLQVMKSSFWSPTYGANLRKVFVLGSLSVAVNRGLGLGNGVVMSGMRDTATVGFGRPLTPKIGANLTAGYARSSGRIGGMQGITETVQGATSMSYRLIRGFSLGAQAGFRYVGVQGQSRSSQVYLGGGINWSPGDLPFVF